MSTKKAIGDSFAAIFILLISQLIAQGIATAFGLIKVPSGVCNIIAGALYAGLAYAFLKIFAAKNCEAAYGGAGDAGICR